MIETFTKKILKHFLSVEERKVKDLGTPKKILIVRQHNQLGDLLACSSLFRALKSKYPQASITIIVSPDNQGAVEKNKYIDKIFIFNKKKLFGLYGFVDLYRILRLRYDVVIVPCTVSISFTSNLLARFSNSSIRIGIKELNGMKNKYAYFFHHRIKMDWRLHPDCNVADFCLEIIRPFGIDIENKKPEVSLTNSDLKNIQTYISDNFAGSKPLIGIHPGAGKPNNRWAVENFVSLAKKIKDEFDPEFYLTGTNADKEILDLFMKHFPFKINLFLNRSIAEVASIISYSDLFITNDTGIMHVAGSTETPQVSIFGPTNPFNWAPSGANKYFLHKSDLINDVSVDEAFQLCQSILQQAKKQNATRVYSSN